jgi:hypothetical protein
MKPPISIKKYFWDIDFSKLDAKKNPEYIAARLLESGDIPALRWLFKTIPHTVLLETAQTSRTLSPKSGNFWASYFGIPVKKMQCLKTSSQKVRRSHWK